jgi:predicted Zn-dependent protease
MQAQRFLSHDDCVQLADRVFGFAAGGGITSIAIESTWTGDLRWARNIATVAGDRRNNEIAIARDIRGATARVQANQIDDTTLQAAVRRAETLLRFEAETLRTLVVDPLPEFTYPETHIWSESTFQQPASARGRIAHDLASTAVRAGVLSAGYLSVSARGSAVINSLGRVLYAPQTLAECSLTVRDPTRGGSGWAGASSYAWSRFDPEHLAATALDKCLRSRDPVAVEPGRYTAILEPQAVFDLFHYVVDQLGRALPEDMHAGPFALPPKQVTYQGVTHILGMSKLGEKILDDRITVSHDPTDPDLGVLPFSSHAEPFRRVTWIDKGVLSELSYTWDKYAVPKLGKRQGYENSGAFRMSGGSTSIDEMIATTKRGLLVTRLSNVEYLDPRSLLMTGVTRDGLWLVENGKVSKSVKNFRFTESPLFVFNNVEQLGEAVPVFSPGRPAVVPSAKVRDFSFTSLVDAV